ncbi:hypothetical protein ACCQ13_14820 [Xanthomonas sp. NCPPB 1638]|uniref:hypothetical protein n=1 Tax=Xanthomonas TaxID=338 RepID=UPI00133121CF|nr:hypothetical protein [Xanthomonas cucurbitae]
MSNASHFVVVYAPQGAGKGRHADALAQMFGCTHVVDEWDGLSPLADGALALTSVSLVAAALIAGSAA